MAASPVLTALKQVTADLVALGLRSESAVIGRLITHIDDAVRGSYSHRTIHETIVAGGLPTSWTNYRIAVGRARKRLGAPPAYQSATPQATGAWTASPRDVAPTSLLPVDTRDAAAPAGTSSATRVLDALQQARSVANSKDYGQIGRDLFRQQQREQRNRRTTAKDQP